MTTGFYLTGGEVGSVPMTWPTPCLASALADGERLSQQGVENLHIWEGEVGFKLSDISQETIQRLLKAFAYYGEEVPFLDLASAAGL